MKTPHIPPLHIFNTLTRQKEKFEPLNAPHVGLYVCGPTVYNDVHLGNCRTFTFFDIVFRYLAVLGYRVRYVRNITDVGHLVGDADEGEDKIGREAKLRNLEPMEVAQRYTNSFREVMRILGNLPPSIEPTATGHLIEQIEMVDRIMANGFAYESQGSVYFDVKKYNQTNQYGILSGRNIEEQLAGSRELEGQSEKKHSADFALWKKANPQHLMRWKSPWSEGFPGWHLECSAMSTKYLGKTFDIHGGGLDLQFPHHECEIAQSVAADGQSPVRYWMHVNMLTMNGTKMSKSVGNVIMPYEMFEGTSPLLSRAYSPMVFRYFILQTHYRSTMDISDMALQAAQKGYCKLMNGMKNLQALAAQVENPDFVFASDLSEKEIQDIEKSVASAYRNLNDDFNTAAAVASLFNLIKKVNMLHAGQLSLALIGKEAFEKMHTTLTTFVENIFGLRAESPNFAPALSVLLETYQQAKAAQDYAKVEALRLKAKEMGITIKDMKTGVDWAYDEN
jgi:cysteinyl-tRNA synthetase